MQTRRLSAWLAVAVLLASGGCGGSGIKLYSVKGKVTHKGQPVKGAFVVFHPKDRANAKYRAAQGITRDDGSYTLGTNVSGDGVMAGEFVITIAKRKTESTAAAAAPMTMGGPPGAAGPGAAAPPSDEYVKKMTISGNPTAKQEDLSDEIPALYAKPETTDKFATITDQGPFEVNLDL